MSVRGEIFDPTQVPPGQPGQDPNYSPFAPSQNQAQATPPDTPINYQEQLERFPGLMARGAIEGVASLPLGLLNIGVGTGNVLSELGQRTSIGGTPGLGGLMRPTPPMELPGEKFSRSLTEMGLPEAQGAERYPLWGIEAILGGKIPGTEMKFADTPANFEDPSVTAAKLRSSVLTSAQEQGHVVPPSTTNPSVLNRVLESFAGKENVQNRAREINDLVRQRTANLTLGQNPATPISRASMESVMETAGQRYEEAKSIPLFRTSYEGEGNFLDRMTQIEAEARGANESFPGARRPDVTDLVNQYMQPSMTGAAAVDAIKLLRRQATAAFDGGNPEMGRVYRQIQNALELELEKAGQKFNMPQTVQNLRDARTLYAKAATIRDAMEPDGTVTGPGLARAWSNNVPLSGPLESSAEFAKQFPKANISASATGSNVHHLTSVGAGLAGLEGMRLALERGHGWPYALTAGAGLGAAWPTGRAITGRVLTSPWWQRNMTMPAAATRGAPAAIPAGAYAVGLRAMMENSQ